MIDFIGEIKKISFASEKGFSLLEVIFALFIVSIALLGILTLTTYVGSAGGASSSKLVAASLAQEGIEVVKNIRDLNFDASGWNNWYDSISETATNYIVQYDDDDLRSFSDTPLRYDSVSGLYGYDAGSDTPYKRVISLTKNPGGSDANEIKVSVQITWSENSRSYSLIAEDRLWNWR